MTQEWNDKYPKTHMRSGCPHPWAYWLDAENNKNRVEGPS